MTTSFLYPKKTKRFSSYDYVPLVPSLVFTETDLSINSVFIFLDWNCNYTRKIITNTLGKRSSYCFLINDVKEDPLILAYQKKFPNYHPKIIQFSDFENIVWEFVLSERTCASSYLVRKGLSRKAQLSLQIERFLKKHPTSILKKTVPETHIIETWEIFQDNNQSQNGSSQNSAVNIQFGAGFSTNFNNLYDFQRISIRQKLEWSFTNNIELLFPSTSSSSSVNDDKEDRKEDTHWILKPSVTNKGMDISILSSYDELLDILEEKEDIREWVLQKYVKNPLLILNKSNKFHFRVYIVCIGALQVFLFNEILILIAANK
jgi:tubulin--tyrosine ligase